MADRAPPLFVEALAALLITGSMTLLRIALMPWTGDRAPFAFVFVAVVGSTVLAGWRSGLMALVLGQTAAWYLIVDPASYAAQRLQYIGGFTVSALAELIALAILALYQREIDKAWSKREAQVDLLHQALAEIDHRTTNNYQTVLALVLAQARRADAPVKEALQQVADRIRAIATASKQLALSSDSLAQVRVADHLGELCAQIQKGLSRPGVRLECHFDDISLPSDEAVAMSILVNELVTNALKHAFPDDRSGAITVTLRRAAGELVLEVADNGVGMKRSSRTRGTGIGSRLVETFVKQVKARHQVSTGDEGTRHRIHFPASPV